MCSVPGVQAANTLVVRYAANTPVGQHLAESQFDEPLTGSGRNKAGAQSDMRRMILSHLLLQAGILIDAALELLYQSRGLNPVYTIVQCGVYQPEQGGERRVIDQGGNPDDPRGPILRRHGNCFQASGFPPQQSGDLPAYFCINRQVTSIPSCQELNSTPDTGMNTNSPVNFLHRCKHLPTRCLTNIRLAHRVQPIQVPTVIVATLVAISAG